MVRVASWLLLATLVLSCSAPSPPRDDALPAGNSVSLRIVEFSGNRYVLSADVDSVKNVPLMVHGNSRMYLSLTHEVGEALNGSPVGKVEDYGYSARGKGVIRVHGIRIGGEAFRGASEVPVFDFVEESDPLVQGMVGVPFLIAANAAVDFTRDRLLLGVARQTRPDQTLLAGGYRSVPMTIGAGGRATVEARFPAIQRILPITPSTVSTSLTLHLPLFEGAVPMTREAAPDRSPSGTTTDAHRTDRIELEIAGVRMWTPASFEDFAEYGNVPERELESLGMLGFDWMKEHRAVLDYANRRLYFRP
jgi:hypothetical protein